jgi:hypothetical protein
MPDRRYVVTRPYPESGLGSNLASMAGALYLAKRLDRDLLVDWRGMVFLKDPTVNYFTQYFAELPEFDGVRIHYAPSPDQLEASEEERLETVPDEQRTLLANADSLPTYVVLTPYHGLVDRMGTGDRAADHVRLRRFYRALTLRPEIQEKADAFYAEHLDGGFVVALNIATANMKTSGTGRYYYGRFDMRILDDEERFLKQVSRAVSLALRGLPLELRQNRRIFYATESASMSELLGRLDGACTRRTVYAPADTGRFFVDYDTLGYSDYDASADMVIDHYLLSRCDALIYNGSMFSNYARVLTNYFSGNCRNIESLYAHYWLLTASRRARAAYAAVRSSYPRRG